MLKTIYLLGLFCNFVLLTGTPHKNSPKQEGARVLQDGHAAEVPQSVQQKSRIQFGILEGQKQHKRPVESKVDRGFGP